MNSTEKLLSARNLKKYFPVPGSRGRLQLKANDGIDLDIYRGETLGVVGESGCGKSTLGRVLLQLYRPTQGSVVYHRQGQAVELTQLRYQQMRPLRKDLQIIFQDPYSALNPRMTIGRIIGEGLITHNFYKPGDPALQRKILQVMEQCGLQGHMLQRYPHQFSGGQRQRVAIARALAVEPEFVVCDECVSALDVSIQAQILELLQRLKQERGLTYLFISHDLSVVRYISDRICVMYLGSVMELCSAESLFADPRHPYTVALLSAIPSTDIESLKRPRILLEGSIPSPIRPPAGCKFHTRCYMACEKCRQQTPALAQVEPGHWVACHFPRRKLDEKGEYRFDHTQ